MPNERRHFAARQLQSGFTLVELLVAAALGLIVVLACVSGLIVARRGFNTVDATSQLRDNGRFAVDILQKIVGQTGYLAPTYAMATMASSVVVAGATAAPNFIEGFNNSVVDSATAPYASNGSRSTSTGLGCTASGDTACANGSDVLVLRYQASESFNGSTSTDATMIDCNGVGQNTPPASRSDLIVNIIHVQRGPDGEPALMCSSNANITNGTFLTQPLIQGVETFQVLYGVDAVTAGAAATATQDSIIDQYLRADQLVVPGNAAATQENFRRVRSLRIGMVLRAAANSAQELGTPVMYALGANYGKAADVGSVLLGQNDGRLRQAVTFVVYLHNFQDS